MTESELVESIQLALGNGVSSYAVFWTLVGGYLVTAYLAGTSLSSSQVRIVNSLFLTAALFNTFGTYSFFSTAMSYADELTVLNPARNEFSGIPVGTVALIVNVLIICAALKFMLDVRASRNDDT